MSRFSITSFIPIIILIICGSLFCCLDSYLIDYVLNSIKSEIIPVDACGQNYSLSFMAEVIPSAMLDESGAAYGNYDTLLCMSSDDQKDMTDGNSSEATEAYEVIPEDADTSYSDISSEYTDTESVTDTVPALNLDGIVSGPTPINYSMAQLCDFETLLSNCYVVDSSTVVNSDELDANKLLSMDMGIDISGDAPKVLIYHTHGSEAFSDSREGVTEDTVIGVGDELARILEEDYGIKVYHDRNVYDYVNGVLDRSNAYNLAGAAVDRILEENPSIEVILDVHRDGVRDDLRLVRTVDGRETAQIMFLNGVSRLKSSGDIEYLYNPHKEENLSFSLKMFLNGRSLYGDLIRKIYIRGYCFNLDRVARASLIEVGAQTNTVQEAKNAMIPLARIIYQVLSE